MGMKSGPAPVCGAVVDLYDVLPTHAGFYTVIYIFHENPVECRRHRRPSPSPALAGLLRLAGVVRHALEDLEKSSGRDRRIVMILVVLLRGFALHNRFFGIGQLAQRKC